MPYDQLSSRGFYQVWPKGFFSPFVHFILLFSLICKEREGKVFVHPPLLINENFWSKKKGGGGYTHGPELQLWSSPCSVPANRDPSESKKGKEGDRAEGKEGSGWWFTAGRLTLEN